MDDTVPNIEDIQVQYTLNHGDRLPNITVQYTFNHGDRLPNITVLMLRQWI